jgi:hypothetical protein
MTDLVDTRVTPTLHSGSFKGTVVGYDDATAPYLSTTIEAFDDAVITLGKLHDARTAARANKAWTAEQAVLKVSDAAEKNQVRLSKKFDALNAALTKQVDHFEQLLTQPLEVKAALPIAKEIRAHLKELESGDRVTFLHKAIQAGDEKTISSALGAPSYLSGLTDDMSKVLTRMWHARNSPDVAHKLNAVTSARDYVQTNAPLLFGEIEKSVGANAQTVRALRAGDKRAIAALRLVETGNGAAI